MKKFVCFLIINVSVLLPILPVRAITPEDVSDRLIFVKSGNFPVIEVEVPGENVKTGVIVWTFRIADKLKDIGYRNIWGKKWEAFRNVWPCTGNRIYIFVIDQDGSYTKVIVFKPGPPRKDFEQERIIDFQEAMRLLQVDW